MKIANALALAAVAGAINALGPKDALAAQRGVTPIVTPYVPKAPPPPKRKDYYAENGAREVARRKRRIDAGKMAYQSNELGPWLTLRKFPPGEGVAVV